MLHAIRKCFSTIEKVKASVFDSISKNEKLNGRSIEYASDFKSLGLNSLDVIELLVDLEEELKVNLNEDEIVSILTVDQTIKAFSDHLSKDQPTNGIIL